MPLEQALQELQKYANDFASIGDASVVIINNRDVFMHKLMKVIQYFNYIWNNDNSKRNIWLEALDIVDDIRYTNPSLDRCINQIIESKLQKKSSKAKAIVDFDPSALLNKIDSYVNEIQSMQTWDTNEIDDIEWQFQSCKKQLVENRDAFDKHVFDSLMSDIDISLNKIARFKKMASSDLMESVNRL